MTIRRYIQAAFVSALVCLIATPAHTQQTRNREEALRCVEAFETSQRLRRDSELLEAREDLLVCGRELCPFVVRRDCTRWLAEVDQTIPTLVFRVVDSQGADVPSAWVILNADAPKPLDGSPVAVNPGSQQVRIEAEGYQSKQLTVLARAGEKLRNVGVELTSLRDTAAVEAEPKAQPSLRGESGASGARVASYVLGGAGVAALGTFTYFALNARTDDRALDQCFPRCAPDRVDSIRQRYLIANISLGIGVVALGVATYLFLTSDDTSPEQRTVHRQPVLADVMLTPTGGGVSAAITF